MRPIDADALRDRLHNLADDEWNLSTPTTWAEAFAECADMVDDAPTIEPEPHWIPWNSGRFPKESGTYTVTAYDGATKRVTYAKYQKRLKRWELTGARAYWRVLAWMPLPKAYKEGEG